VGTKTSIERKGGTEKRETGEGEEEGKSKEREVKHEIEGCRDAISFLPNLRI